MSQIVNFGQVCDFSYIFLECCESKCLNNTPRVIEPGSKYQLGAALIPLPYKTGFDLTRTHDDRGIKDYALFVVTEPKTVKYVFLIHLIIVGWNQYNRNRLH